MNVQEDSVRYTFAPIAPVDFVDLAIDGERAMAYIRMSSNAGAESILGAARDNPFVIEGCTVSVEWSKDYQSRRQQPRSARSAVQEQLDWVTNSLKPSQNAQASQNGAQVSTDFVWDQLHVYKKVTSRSS